MIVVLAVLQATHSGTCLSAGEIRRKARLVSAARFVSVCEQEGKDFVLRVGGGAISSGKIRLPFSYIA